VKNRRRTTGTESWLGASQPVGTLIIVIFVPSQDRDGNQLDHELRVSPALETLGTTGAAAYPRARGAITGQRLRGECQHPGDQGVDEVCHKRPKKIYPATCIGRVAAIPDQLSLF
jgi:hypothetical protein